MLEVLSLNPKISEVVLIASKSSERNDAVGWVFVCTQRPITFEGMSNVRSCAVVGNAGHLLQHEYGSFIDNHELVVRHPSLPLYSTRSGFGL
jgi:hypothetical protein